MKGLSFVVIATAAVLGASVDTVAAPRFTLTELGGVFFSDDLRVSNAGTPYVQSLSQYGNGFYPSDRNSSGDVIGNFGSSSADYRAVLLHTDPATGLPTLTRIPFQASFPAWSIGWDINDHGDMLGGDTTGTYTNLQIVTADGSLIVPGGSTYRRPSFNDRFDIVGADVLGGAFYQDSSGRYDLQQLVENLSGFAILSPTDINDAGYIVGYGKNSLGQNSAFLLTPVPLPGAGSLLVCGLAGLCRFFTRKTTAS